MMWNMCALWFTLVLVFKVFIQPMFLDEENEEQIDAYGTETSQYLMLLLPVIAICNIMSMIVS